MPTLIHQPTAPHLPADLIAAWAGVSTTIAADLFLGRTLVDPAIRPLRPFARRPRLAGHAVTAWCEAADYGPVHHAIAVAERGDVIVVDAGGRGDAAMIGELLSGAARLKGIAGVVVDGAVRDTGTLAQWDDFAVFTRWITPRGPSSKERGSVNGAVMLGRAPVAPRDLILGDDDGLVVIPNADAGKLIAQALAMVDAEAAWERELGQGRSTIDVFGVPTASSAQG
jgi:4-hydroxy-4-methyl-2-oxoglutarate aldolase